VRWGWSTDQETYTLCDSRDDALDGLDGEGGWVAQLGACDNWLAWESVLTALNLLEMAADHHYDSDQGDPDGERFCDPSATQLDELESELRSVALAWIERHGLRWSTWHQVVHGTEERVEEPGTGKNE